MSTFVRFLLVGGVAAVVNWLSRFGLSLFMPLEAAVTFAYILGMTCAYLLSRVFVFEASGRSIHNEFARFAIVNVFALGVVLGITLLLVRYVFPTVGFDWHPEAIAHGIGVLSPAVTSYLGHRHFTFGKKV